MGEYSTTFCRYGATPVQSIAHRFVVGQGLPLPACLHGRPQGYAPTTCVCFLFSLSPFSRNENGKKQHIVFQRKPNVIVAGYALLHDCQF